MGFRSLFFVFDGQVLQGINTASSLVVLLTTLVAGLLFGVPLLLVTMGLIVATILLAMYLPIFRLAGSSNV